MAKKQTVPHFSSFPQLMEMLVLPHRQTHPEYERLDGLSGKGNRSRFATFNHFSKKWKIANDTKIKMLLVAWELYQDGKEPFLESITNGSTLCLRLNECNSEKAQGLYIYFAGAFYAG